MDFRRHLTSGRLSELFGESQVPTDTLLRTLGDPGELTATVVAHAGAMLDAGAARARGGAGGGGGGGGPGAPPPPRPPAPAPPRRASARRARLQAPPVA